MPNVAKNENQHLYVALQKGAKQWKVLMANHKGDTLFYKLQPGDFNILLEYIDHADSELKIKDNTYSCYLSSHVGHWLDRALNGQMIKNVVIEMNSLPFKPTLEDQIALLKTYISKPETEPFRVLKVPTLEEELFKHLKRECKCLRSERLSHITRIRSLLDMQGLVDIDPPTVRVAKIRDWNGKKLHPIIVDEVKREQKRYDLVNAQYEAAKALYDKEYEKKMKLLQKD